MATPAENLPPVPLQQVLPYIISGSSAIFSGVIAMSRFFISFISRMTRPILIFSPIPMLLYIFAPVLVLSELILEVFIYLPYQLVVYFLDAFYPIYVFCGVACLTGALLGLIMKLAITKSMDLVMNGHSTKEEETAAAEKAKRTRIKAKAKAED